MSMKVKIKEYIDKQALEDDQLREGLKNDKKTCDKMEQYIIGEAKKHLEGKNGAIEDNIVFGWAIHYWTDYVETDTPEHTPAHTPNPKHNAEPAKVIPKTKTKLKVEPKVEQMTLFDLE